MFQTKVVQKIMTHTLCFTTFFKKLHNLWDNVEIYCKVTQIMYDIMEHMHCMLDT